MIAAVVSVTYFENGMRAVSFVCPSCGAKHDDFGWPDGGLKGGNVLGYVRCNADCGAGFDVTIPAWALSPRHRTYKARNAAPDAMAGSFAGQHSDDQAIDNPIPNWTE